MQAVILAGGFGTRLKPVLDELETIKPMVPIEGKPFLEYLIALLKKSGITNIVICLYHMPEKITDYFKDGSKFGVNIRYSIEEQPLMSAGALKYAEHLLEEDFLLFNGDNYFEINHKKLFEQHKKTKAFITLGTTDVGTVETFGICNTFYVENGKIILEFGKEVKPKSNEAHTGTFIIKKEIIKNLPENTPISLEKELFGRYLKQGRVVTMFTKGYYIDIGTPEMYEKFKQDVKKGRIKL